MTIVVVSVDKLIAARLEQAATALGYGLAFADSTACAAPAADTSVVVCQAGIELGPTIERLQSTAQCPVLVVLETWTPQSVDALLAAGAYDVVSRHAPIRQLRDRLERAVNSNPADAAGLRLLLELTHALTSTHDIQEVLFTLVSRIAEVVHVDRVSLVLVPVGQDIGYVVAASDDARLTRLPLDLRKYPEIQHVLRQRTPLTVKDATTHPVLDGVRTKVTDSNVRALSLLPLQNERECMGVLFIRSAGGNGALNDRQLEFCQILTNATAIALHNAQVLQDLKEQEKRGAEARRHAELRLETLGRYADLFESSVDGVVAFDGQFKLLFANPAAYQLLGSDEGLPAQGRSMMDWVAPESARRAVILAGSFKRGQYPRNVDLQVHGSHGTRTLNGSFSALKGTADAVLFSFRDVTDARRIQHELEHTQRFLQSMVDASVDAIVAADMDGRIVLFNEAAQKLYGYTQEQAKTAITVHALYPDDGAREVGRMLRGSTHGGPGRLRPVRMVAVNADGETFPISLTAATIYGAGRPTATFGIFTDLRERIRVEEQLAKAQQQLAVSEKQALVAELAGAMAHELNQPLTSVMASAELLLRKLGDQHDLARAISRMHSEATRIAEVVRKIGHLTRYETTPYVGNQKILDLDRATRDHDSEPAGDAS